MKILLFIGIIAISMYGFSAIVSGGALVPVLLYLILTKKS